MPFTASQVLVKNDKAYKLFTATGVIQSPMPFTITNQDSTGNSVWIGGATVTTSAATVGMELKAGATLSGAVIVGDDLYARSNVAGGVRVDVLLGRQ